MNQARGSTTTVDVSQAAGSKAEECLQKARHDLVTVRAAFTTAFDLILKGSAHHSRAIALKDTTLKRMDQIMASMSLLDGSRTEGPQ